MGLTFVHLFMFREHGLKLNGYRVIGELGLSHRITPTHPDDETDFFSTPGVTFFGSSAKVFGFCFDTSCRVAYSFMQICETSHVLRLHLNVGQVLLLRLLHLNLG